MKGSRRILKKEEERARHKNALEHAGGDYDITSGHSCLKHQVKKLGVLYARSFRKEGIAISVWAFTVEACNASLRRFD